MKQYNNVQKISTGIQGLDKLLLGGLQLPMGFSHKSNGQGVVITIKGCKGTDKTLFAMQLMHGITKSLRSCNNDDDFQVPVFYSLNKNEEQLNDILLDFIISKNARKMIKSRVDKREEFAWSNSSFSDILFDTRNNVKMEYEPQCKYPQLPNDLRTHLDRYISDEIVYYNIRTNSLHFRTGEVLDSQSNRLFERKHDSFNDYSTEMSEFSRTTHYEKQFDDFRNDFFEVQLNLLSEDAKTANYNYSGTPSQRFTRILSEIQEKNNENSEGRYSPCIVIDGISQIDKSELYGLEFSEIENIIRKSALVSIIVIDDIEENLSVHSDISIEMRRSDNEEINYATHELRINKSVFQMSAYGWHQYKKRDYGIEVYPSSHLLLHRKRYLPQSIINSQSSILDTTYLQFVDNLKEGNENNIEQYVEFEGKRQERIYQKLRNLYANRLFNTASSVQDVLNILLAQRGRKPDGEMIAIIGKQNSFKRFLAIGSSFFAAKKGIHTLFLTFDRPSSNLLQQMQCPALMNKLDKQNPIPCVKEVVDKKYGEKEIVYSNVGGGVCSPLCTFECKLKECKTCYDYLHTFNINMGCISADEFLHFLKEQFDIYFKEGNGINRIIIDDLQKIDFCFPLLKSNSLFLAALKNFCYKRGVDLIVLCDEKAGLVEHLKSLSENVICMEQDFQKQSDNPANHTYGRAKVQILKFSGNILPSQVFEAKCDKIQDIFVCDKEGEHVLFDESLENDENNNHR